METNGDKLLTEGMLNATLDARLKSFFEEIKTYLSTLFKAQTEEVRQFKDELVLESKKYMEFYLKETKRHTTALKEDFQHRLGPVAEQVITLTERVDKIEQNDMSN